MVSLVFSAILVLGFGLSHRDTIVFYAESNKPEFLQIYFPVFSEPSEFSAYSEQATERTAYEGRTGDAIGIALPKDEIQKIRVDPADHAVVIFIKNVKIDYLFTTVILSPSELIDRIQPLQGIKKIELVGDRLLIETTDEDPQFELAIYKPANSVNYKRLSINLLAFSALIYLVFFVIAKGTVKELFRVLPYFVVPLIASLSIVWIFYPGFMTYDTLHALNGARHGVTDSTWPPVVSYVWRGVDLISLNPALMFFLQVFLLLASTYYVMCYFLKNNSVSALLFVFYLSLPVVLGTLAAIWKDVLMASFFVAGFAVMLVMKNAVGRRLYLLFTLSIVLIFLAVCSRHNAITAAIPFLFYGIWLLGKHYPASKKRSVLCIISSLILVTVVYGAKIQLDNHSLPEFRELKGASALIRVTRVMDVAGASVCAERNLLESIAPNLELAEIKANYDPRHSNLSSGFFHKIDFDEKLDKLWIKVAVEHPVCFLYNKLMLSKFLIGANNGQQFLVVSPQIDANKYGYSLAASPLREAVVRYVVEASRFVMLKPWVLYLASISLFFILVVRKKMCVEIVVVYMSAGLYFAGLAAFGNAADARLLFYTTTMSVIGIASMAGQLLKVNYLREV
jgi:hypothetical protein